MIDLVIQSQASLNALSSLFYMVLFLAGIAALGIALRFIAKRKILKRLGALLIILPAVFFIFLLVSIFWPRSKKKFDLRWNLEKRHTLYQLNAFSCPAWESTHINQTCIWEGDGKVEMSFPEGLNFSEKTRLVWVSMERRVIGSITVTTDPYSTEGAFKRAEALFRLWGLDDDPLKKLQDWHSNAENGAVENYIHYFRSFESQPRVPQLTILIKRIENKDYFETPWFLSIEFRWYPDEVY